MELISKEDAVALIKAEMDNIRTHSLVDGTARINLRLAKNIIEDMPNIDIVRCKECRWRKQDKSCDLNCRIDYIDGTETDMWFYTEDDDFCSYGERKSE